MKNTTKRPWWRVILQWVGWFILAQFILVNISASIYAYRATHLYDVSEAANDQPGNENVFQKTWRLFTGPKLYRSVEWQMPVTNYDSIRLPVSDKITLDVWSIKTDSTAKGTVILFHGLCGNKGEMLEPGSEFLHLGYNILLVDARHHGKSDGGNTTIGFSEAADVRAAFQYLQAKGEKNIFLWGSSMGGVSIIKALHDYDLQPAGIIAEMPFASLLHYLQKRAKGVGLPQEPTATLINFWIGVEQGFNPYRFDIVKYAKDVRCPVLLQCGDRDYLVPQSDISAIYNAMPSANKKLVLYENTDHEFLFRKQPDKWRQEIGLFLATTQR